MEFILKTAAPASYPSNCLMMAVYSDHSLSAVGQQLDPATQDYIKRLLQQGDLSDKVGDTLLLHSVPGVAALRILLVASGEKNKLEEQAYRKILLGGLNGLKSTGAQHAVCFLHEIEVKGCNEDQRPLTWKIRYAVECFGWGDYRFDQYKSQTQPKNKQTLNAITFSVAATTDPGTLKQQIELGKALVVGINTARNLGNMPANECTPTYLAGQASQLATQYTQVTSTIIDEPEMEELAMNAFLAVTRGSQEAAKLIVMEYNGGAELDKPVVLIGKGVTFDTGGISIKASAGMGDMKYDMCGAASVFGVLTAVAQLNLPIHLIAVIPSCENMPSGNAVKPGDILRTMSGKTIEIANTDAEGRMLLCDALTFVQRYNPAVVIDIATLTGACVVALGAHANALYSNHQPLSDALLQASITAWDRAWPMPLWDVYQQQLDSAFADMSNVGGRAAGSVTAACFLSRFATDYHWAHLDIAGSATSDGNSKSATGRPVSMLVQYLLDRVANNS